MAKRSSLFGVPPASLEAPESTIKVATPLPQQSVTLDKTVEKSRRYPVAKTREGKRVATVYLDRDALRQLQRIAFDEETTLQALLVEGINAVFAIRGLSRIA